MKKLIISILLLSLFVPVFAYAQTSDTTAVMRELNERLERNKAELIKEIRDQNAQNEELISASIDENFGVLDDRMNNFFKDATRDIAIIMVAGFMVGFTLSQVVKIKVEQKRRKALVKRAYELETKVNDLEHKATKLSKVVRELKSLDDKYSKKLEGMKPKKFLNIKTIAFGVGTFVVGAIITFVVVGI